MGAGEQAGKPRRRLGAWAGQSVSTRARRYCGLLTLVLVGGLALAGCGAPSTSSQGALPTPTLSGTALDKAFVDGMVPHHQAALDMAEAELSKGHDLRVKALAQNIVGSQTREIGQMRAIAQRIGAAPPAREWSRPMGPLMGVPISMNMPQMGSTVASAAHPDRAFLLLMIPHHASAILMANEEATDGADPALKTLGQSIYADQAAQIGQMQQLLAVGTT